MFRIRNKKSVSPNVLTRNHQFSPHLSSSTRLMTPSPPPEGNTSDTSLLPED